MSVTLHLGDCLEVIRGIEVGSVDAVVTDPPYGLDLGVANDKRQDCHHLGRKAYDGYEDSYENFVGLIVPRINAALALAKRGAVFTGPHIQEQAKASAIGGIYHPSAVGRTSWGFKNFLPVLFYGTASGLHRGHYPTVLKSTATVKKDGHPCPKPVEWMVWLLELATLPGDTVIDPFMGSGTTGVACARTGRCFIGIERHEPYFRIAERRIAREAEQVKLFI